MPTPHDRYRKRSHRTSEYFINKVRSKTRNITIDQVVSVSERKRIKEAFIILARPEIQSGVRSKESKYENFLRKIQEECGNQQVLASALGIDTTAIKDMDEGLRKQTISQVIQYKDSLESPVLSKLAEEYRVDKGGFTIAD
jgi:hypothetical protein